MDIVTNEQIKNSIKRTVANRKRLAAVSQDATTRRLLDIEEEGETAGSIPDVSIENERTF